VAAAACPQIAADLEDDRADRVVPALVQRPWRHLGRAVDALGPAPEDAALHRVRILAKRGRYACELAIPVAGKDARRLGEAIASLQGVLGDFNDAVVAEAWLRGVARHVSPAQAVVVGQLIAAERQLADAGRAGWRPAWKAASAKRLRKWLDH
jgi:CHAD domain-containing protein